MRSQKVFGIAILALVIVFGLSGGIASAHHSNAEYTNTLTKMEGTVVEYRWRNPHVTVVWDAKDASGKVVRWRGDRVPGAVANVLAAVSTMQLELAVLSEKSDRHAIQLVVLWQWVSLIVAAVAALVGVGLFDATPRALSAAFFFHDPAYAADDEYVQRRYESSIAPGAWEAVAAARFRRPDAAPAPTPSTARAYERIDVPTLVVEGGDDKLLPAGWAAQIAKQIDGARSVVVDKAGHCPQIEQSAAINKLLLDFLPTGSSQKT